MKILYYIDGLNRGGVEIIVTQLASFFYQEGNEIHIVYLYKEMHDLADELSSNIILHPLSFDQNRKPYFQYLRNFKQLTRILKKIQPDIIHAHNSSFSYFFLASAVRISKIKTKNFRTLHFLGFFLERKSNIDKIRFYFDKKASELLHTSIVSVSDVIKRYVDVNYSSNRSILVTNGINIEQIINTKTTKELLGIQSNRVIGIYVSRICNGKNHKILLQSWINVVKTYPSALLILIGDGPLKKECEKYCHDLGIKDNVMFTGSISNVADYLAVADFGVFPSESEGFGLGLCEMMAAGLPVVVSDIPAFRLLIQDNYNGLFFDTYDSNDLSNKINNVLADSTFREKLGHNAKDYVIKNLTLPTMLDKYKKIYQSNK